jgi:hypothetical protein
VQYRLGNVDAFQVRPSVPDPNPGWGGWVKPALTVELAQAQCLMCSCVAAGRWIAVYICPCGPADRHVSVQIQADAADPYVQGPEASHLLPLQYGETQFLPSQILFHFFKDLFGKRLTVCHHRFHFVNFSTCPKNLPFSLSRVEPRALGMLGKLYH